LENEVDFLKNRVENVTHNNEQLVDEVEKMRIENENLRKALNEIGIACCLKEGTLFFRAR